MINPDVIDDAIESLRAEWRRQPLDLTSGPWTVTEAVASADGRDWEITWEITWPEWDASWPLPALPMPGLMPR